MNKFWSKYLKKSYKKAINIKAKAAYQPQLLMREIYGGFF